MFWEFEFRNVTFSEVDYQSLHRGVQNHQIVLAIGVGDSESHASGEEVDTIRVKRVIGSSYSVCVVPADRLQVTL
jgi:hypothetical protein